MAQYDAREIIENIERTLDEREAEEAGLSESSQQSVFRERRIEESKRSLFKRLERGPFPTMRQFQSIDKVPGGARFRFIKRVVARMLRLITGPQTTYNSENLQVMETMAREYDRLQERVRMLEDGMARPFGAVQIQGAEDTRLNNLVKQHLQMVEGNLEQLAGNISEITRSMTQMVDSVSVVSSRLNTMNVKQRDVYTDIASARLDVSRLWTELGLVYESIDRRAEDLWTGLDERDIQLVTNTEAAQQLHGQVSGLNTSSKELKARLLVLTEQLTIHQEMLENLREELEKSPPPSERRGAVKGSSSDRIQIPEEPAIARSPRKISEENELLLKRQLDLAYLRFQRQYRGDEEDLRAFQKEYIELLSKNIVRPDDATEQPRLLDVACGDGVFIELLRQHGWDAAGVDLNEAMVKQGRSRNLPIEQADALGYLEQQPAKSFDAVSMFQFVEHLPPEQLLRLLKLSYRVLRPGGVILVETINPHTMMGLHWFHFDLTHERLIFPEMLALLAETAGFQTIEWRGMNQVSPDDRLKLEGSETERENIERLNKFLFGDQDYYFLARRPGGE